MKFADWVIAKVSRWLLKSQPIQRFYLCDFNLICKNIRPCDILLIEGHSRASTIIRHISQSTWTHAALYIGLAKDIQNPKALKIINKIPHCTPDTQLLIESEIGSGTTIIPISQYQPDNIRILRPSGLTKDDAEKVIAFTFMKLGEKYDLRHLLDLARFLFPWGIFPRRWRSSLFQHNALQPTKDICSSMIAEAFSSVDYPILPLIEKNGHKDFEWIRRNTTLYTPSDFDYSPYFDVIKYPFFPLGEKGAYHQLPWKQNAISDDTGQSYITYYAKDPMQASSPEINQFFTSKAYAVIGASANHDKFGNKVLRCYIQQKLKVYPVNPNEKRIEHLISLPTIASLPEDVKSISIVTPPTVTEQIVDQAIAKGIQNIWMQPGAESAEAIRKCKEHNINVIAGGPCILKKFGFQG